jgi:hypothetical protein
MATKVMERFGLLIARWFTVLEPLTPRFVSFVLRRYLKKLLISGLILNSRTRVERLGKYHYKITVDVDLAQKQTDRLLSEALYHIFGRR